MANPASLTITPTTANNAITQPTTQAIDTNGTVNCPVQSQTDRLLFEIINTQNTALTVTFKAGTGVQAHTARDLVVAMAATGTATDKRIIGPFESARFAKADGSIDVNFQAASGSPAATVRVYRLPKQ